MQPAARSSNQPLGDPARQDGDWRRRLLHYHVPLALASAVVLVLFMSLSPFDANAYPHADTQSGTFPQRREQRGEGGPMGDGGGQNGEADHGRGQTGPAGHSGRQAGEAEQGGGQAGEAEHGAGQTSSSQEIRSDSFFGLSFRRFTVATGYLATGLLALTLLIGPANLLLRKRNPVSNYLRRDAGTWTAIFSVVHVIYGLGVHGSGEILNNAFFDYFIAPDGSPLTNSFGLGNWTGLAATVIVVGLLTLSSDFALRKLKAGRWKWLQRLNYGLFALVIVHAFFYGALLRVTSPYTLLLGLSVIAVFVGQSVGVWLWRQRHSRTTPGQSA